MQARLAGALLEHYSYVMECSIPLFDIFSRRNLQAPILFGKGWPYLLEFSTCV